MEDLKHFSPAPQPFLTKADKKKITIEASGLVLIFVLGLTTFLLLAMMYNTSAPQAIQTSEEVMSK